MRYFVIVALALSLVGCATTSPTMFSGKPVIQFDQGQAFVLYVKLSMQYAVLKYQITAWCAAKAIPEATCQNFALIDQQVVKANDDIQTSITNPAYPVDMAKVQIFADLILSTLVKVGVKGVTAGVMP